MARSRASRIPTWGLVLMLAASAIGTFFLALDLRARLGG